MFLNFLIYSFLFFNFIKTRIFRLKHPKIDVFIGGEITKPYFVEMAESYTFEDVESVERPGYVRVVVPAVKGLWHFLKKENYLIFHKNQDTQNQLFGVHENQDTQNQLFRLYENQDAQNKLFRLYEDQDAQNKFFRVHENQGSPNQLLRLYENQDAQNKFFRVHENQGSPNQLLRLYENQDTLNQLFKVHFLARDVVAIESHIGGCLKFDEDDEKFILAECNYLTNFKNQTFLITNVDGKWFGHGSTKEGWGLPIEDQIAWGMCETCVPGGFGSEEQGNEFDKDVASGQYKTDYTDEENTKAGEKEESTGPETNADTVGIMNPFSYRNKPDDELGKSMPHEYNGPFPSTYLINKKTRQSSRDGTATDGNADGRTYKIRHNLDFPRKMVPELADDESYAHFAKTGKLLDMRHQDSFGNEMKSEDHRLDEVFDNLSTEAKKDTLNLAGIYTGRKNGFTIEKRAHNQPVAVGDITMGFGHRWE